MLRLHVPLDELPQSVLDIPNTGPLMYMVLFFQSTGVRLQSTGQLYRESKTGITTMFTNGIDTGDMLLKDEIEIPVDMTVGELHDIMSLQGARPLIKTLRALENGTLIRTSRMKARLLMRPK